MYLLLDLLLPDLDLGAPGGLPDPALLAEPDFDLAAGLPDPALLPDLDLDLDLPLPDGDLDLPAGLADLLAAAACCPEPAELDLLESESESSACLLC